jgi:hypothetical protein
MACKMGGGMANSRRSQRRESDEDGQIPATPLVRSLELPIQRAQD